MTILRVVNPYTLIVASTMNMIITNLSVENYNIKNLIENAYSSTNIEKANNTNATFVQKELMQTHILSIPIFPKLILNIQKYSTLQILILKI